MTAYAERTIGPFKFKFRGIIDAPDGEPIEATTIAIPTRKGDEFQFDDAYIEAVALAITPVAEVFRLKENDSEPTPEGVKRGDLRLYPSLAFKKWGGLANRKARNKGKKEEYFPMARLVTNAKAGEGIEFIDKSEVGRRNYCRSNLRNPPDKSAKTNTRAAFIKAVTERVALLQGDSAAADHEEAIQRAFGIADGIAPQPQKETEQ